MGDSIAFHTATRTDIESRADETSLVSLVPGSSPAFEYVLTDDSMMRDATIDTHRIPQRASHPAIQRLVDGAPPLTVGQREHLAVLLGGDAR